MRTKRRFWQRRPGPRRAITWAVILLAVSVLLVVLAANRGAGAVFGQTLRIAIGLLCWALAMLTWNLAVVWIEYVSQSRHLQRLRHFWRVPGRDERRRPAVRKATDARVNDAPTGLWWLEGDRLASEYEPPRYVSDPLGDERPGSG